MAGWRRACWESGFETKGQPALAICPDYPLQLLNQQISSVSICCTSGARGEPEASQKLCAYLMETALLKLPEGQETVLGIFDFEGAGAQNIDLEFAKFLVSISHILLLDIFISQAIMAWLWSAHQITSQGSVSPHPQRICERFCLSITWDAV